VDPVPDPLLVRESGSAENGKIWKLKFSPKMYLFTIGINGYPARSKKRWHTATAFVCRLLTSAWKSTAPFNIREMAHGFVTAARGEALKHFCHF
jgi:hypothetical protein